MENHQTINLNRDGRNHYKRRISTISDNHKKFERLMDFSSERSHSYIYDEGMEVSYMSNMNDKMSDVLIDTDTLKRDTNELKTDITDTKNHVIDIKTNLTDVKNDVSTIKTDINNLSTSFKTSVSAIQTNVDNIDKNMTDILDAKFENFKGEFHKSVSKIQVTTGLSAIGIIVAIIVAAFL